jgi:hypothetical protein
MEREKRVVNKSIKAGRKSGFGIIINGTSRQI